MIADARVFRADAKDGAGLFEPILVDLFAGGGGASVGIERAMGRCVDVAVNHCPDAVAMHRVNHPHTLHLTADVFEVDPLDATGGRPVRLLWASPDCTYFSKARGGKPIRHVKRRALAWVVIRWAELPRPQRPEVIILENVEEFADWGPLTDEGRPCPDRKGETFRKWVGQLEALGYDVQWRILRACDFGAPTIRKRLFLIARCDGKPIIWPRRTHGNVEMAPDGETVVAGGKRFRTAAECIDWSLPCPSIFTRKKPLAENTLRRIARGVMRFVVEHPDPFIISIANYGGNGAPVHSIDDPLRTITANPKGGHHALVVPSLVSTNHGDSGGRRSYPMDEPMRTVCAASHGEALVTAFLAKHNGGATGQAVTEPAHTFAGHINRALVSSHLVKLRGTCKDGQRVDEPAPTITSGGTHIGLVAALLCKYYGTKREGCDITDPLHTITTKERFGLVTCTIDGETYVITDIGMRMLQPHELYAAQGFPKGYIHDRGVDEHGRRVKFTKTVQVRLCGNSVCPPVAQALVRSNVTAFHTRHHNSADDLRHGDGQRSARMRCDGAGLRGASAKAVKSA